MRRRLGWACGLLFLGFVFGSAGGYSQIERIRYGALPLGLALLCGGAVAYLWGRDVFGRDHFHPTGARRIRLTGRHVKSVGWALIALGVWLSLLGIAVVIVWLRPQLVAG